MKRILSYGCPMVSLSWGHPGEILRAVAASGEALDGAHMASVASLPREDAGEPGDRSVTVR